ncbi:RNA polymerase sigma factor [Corynebacterium genitalium]|nr:RNA polymerase sigma factor [Corynebacterium genitalium]
MTERELIQQAVAGSETAFSQLIARNETRLWNVCFRITANHHDAEDAFAAAVYLGWKNLAKFRGESGFGTWMYRIASNASYEVVRRRRPEVSIDAPLDDDDTSPAMDLADPKRHFEESLADNDELSVALAQLPADAREALILAEIAGMKLAEIAEHQGASLSATKVRVHRARKTMRELLG